MLVMKTLQINVPDDLFGVLSNITKQKDGFVVDAIREKIERQSQISLLIEGYQATFDEDLAITREFQAADFESL